MDNFFLGFEKRAYFVVGAHDSFGQSTVPDIGGGVRFTKGDPKGQQEPYPERTLRKEDKTKRLAPKDYDAP